MSGALLGLALCVLDMTWGEHAARALGDAAGRRAAGADAVPRSVRSGVYAMAALAKSPALPAAMQPAVEATPMQDRPFPFSFLGKITEGGEETILLHGAGRTLKVRHAGPLDERYVVDDVLEDRIVIRDLSLGTRHVVELAAREYAIPGSLRGEYPQD